MYDFAIIVTIITSAGLIIAFGCLLGGLFTDSMGTVKESLLFMIPGILLIIMSIHVIDEEYKKIPIEVKCERNDWDGKECLELLLKNKEDDK